MVIKLIIDFIFKYVNFLYLCCFSIFYFFSIDLVYLFVFDMKNVCIVIIFFVWDIYLNLRKILYLIYKVIFF